MSTIRAYKMQMRPRFAQLHMLSRISGGLRWLWNHAIAEQQRRREAGEKYVGYVGMCEWLKSWRNSEEFSWISESPIHAQQQCLKRLDEAYQRFFQKTGGYPKFKRRGEDPGIRFPQPNQIQFDAAHSRIKLPKLGFANLRVSQKLEGEIRNASVRRVGKEWFCSVQVEQERTTLLSKDLADAGPTLAIDLGVVHTATMVDVAGKAWHASHAKGPELDKKMRRLKRYQRSVSRKCKGSKNRRKAIDKLKNLHLKLSNQRKDFVNKLTTQLASQHAIIVMEDLRVKNMTGSAKGTAEAPGKNVRQKAGLNRSILQQMWGEIRRQLEYKLPAVGGALVKIDPKNTSRSCSCCGHVSADNRKSQAKFVCVSCGHTENADINAGKNILSAGQARWLEVRMDLESKACGESIRRSRFKKRGAASVKQETQDDGS